MPTVFRSGPYRFYFFSHEPNEPPHIHVDHDNFSAKFWLNPVTLAKNIGFTPRELSRLHRLTENQQQDFLEAWNEYFGAPDR